MKTNFFIKLNNDFYIKLFNYYELKHIENKEDFYHFLSKHIFYPSGKPVKYLEKFPTIEIFYMIWRLYIESIRPRDIKNFSTFGICPYCGAKNSIITNFNEIKFNYEKDKYPYIWKKCSNCHKHSIFNLPEIIYNIDKILDIYKKSVIISSLKGI